MAHGHAERVIPAHRHRETPEPGDRGARQLAGAAIGGILPRLAREPGLLAGAGLRASHYFAPHAGAILGERRLEPRVDVPDEFAVRLSWGKRMHVELPVVDLSPRGMLLDGEPVLATADRVRIELVGRMWRFAGRGRIVSGSEGALRLKVIEWDGRAIERVREFVAQRVRLLNS
jgi:hypothetical protein